MGILRFLIMWLLCALSLPFLIIELLCEIFVEKIQKLVDKLTNVC